MRSLTDTWTLGGHRLPNRLVLAPLAGIGNWFVRLQAKRYGAGLCVSEMVSSFGLKYGDQRTHREFLRIHPDEHPVAIQLFGHDPEVMGIAAEIVDELGVPVVISGGLRSDEQILAAFERTGADAVMLARGSLGNPWRFERLLGRRDGEPTLSEVVDELGWVIDRAEEHLGTDRAGRYLRKFYPWYCETMGLPKRAAHELSTAPTTAHARAVLDRIAAPLAA